MEHVICRLATTPERFAALVSDECVEGYNDGRSNEPCPGPNRSDSYVHGWWNGMADGYHRRPHPVDQEIVKLGLVAWREAFRK